MYYIIYRAKNGSMRTIKRYGYAAAKQRYFKLIAHGYQDVSMQMAKE